MRITCLALSVLAAAGLSGCAQMRAVSSDYVEPSSGPTARVRFLTNANIVAIPDRSCVDWSAPRAGVVVSNKTFVAGKPAGIGKTLGMPGTPPQGLAMSEVKVTGNTPITLFFESFDSEGNYHYFCDFKFSFLPKEGEDYEVTIVGPRNCDLKIKSLTNPSLRVNGYKAEACK